MVSPFLGEGPGDGPGLEGAGSSTIPGLGSAPLSYREACALIEARGLGIRPDLSRIAALAELLNHPERTYPTVHVAGTNGKSSTARMTGAILAANGLTAGIYTSPHLQSLRERFIVAGPTEDAPVAIDYISPEDFAELLQYLLPFVQMVEASAGEQVTYFELTSAMAFEWMAGRSVSVAVVEAGLGGSWDATNIIAGDVGVLTRVAVDHIALLGATPRDNAREKAGIIKAGATVVSAAQEPEVVDVLQARASEVGATLAFMDQHFRLLRNEAAYGGRLISAEGPAGGRYEELFVPLLGAHQGLNAGLALAAAEALVGRQLDVGAVAAGLEAVRSPGRLEIVSREPLIVLDGAHNPHAAAALGPALSEVFRGKQRIFVMSIFQDKDVAGVLAAVLPFASHIILTQSSSPKAAAPEVLAAAARSAGFAAQDVEVTDTVAQAVARARELAGTQGMVVVTGSLYAVGEARDLLLGPVD
ncbi:MAG: folylpolyglutamate synthase/dihydrofolate synthase family protein [Actinomycetota bacterium]